MLSARRRESKSPDIAYRSESGTLLKISAHFGLQLILDTLIRLLDRDAAMEKMTAASMYKTVHVALFGTDGRVGVWRRPGERIIEAEVDQSVHFGGGLVMVWGGIALDTITESIHAVSIEAMKQFARLLPSSVVLPCLTATSVQTRYRYAKYLCVQDTLGVYMEQRRNARTEEKEVPENTRQPAASSGTARLPYVKIRERPRRKSNPVHLSGRRVVWPYTYKNTELRLRTMACPTLWQL
ncbi:hypothetical protein PR048_025070 [Dryococelus australis]|uniref:Uncharacterized protein n=1 Tax=Dryococelus australis TaxID=614101 RepID=A0ABQ9GQD9_9NEOP|nr:hypothetical protein PR048_025070 [Dryococelus australis]